MGEENDLCDLGSILVWEGLIVSQQTLECKSCSDLIPNCLACRNSATCDQCQSGYLLADIYDSDGEKNTICIPDFCGFYGKGDLCTGTVTLEGCAKSSES